MVNDSPKKARLYLGKPDVIAVVSLLDLYKFPLPFPKDVNTVSEKFDWAKNELEHRVGFDNFYQYFAVHETEAWLLSDPMIFPPVIRARFPKSIKKPEEVNFKEPPAILLDYLYRSETKKHYKKVTYGKTLFNKLDPSIVYDHCPYFKLLCDKLLALAKAHGG